MRKFLILITLVCFFVHEADAQKRTAKKGRYKGHSSRKGGGGKSHSGNNSPVIGLPISGMTTWLTNPYYKSQPKGEMDYNFSLGGHGGLMLGYEFSAAFTISVSGLYSIHQQKFSGRKKGYLNQTYYDYTSASSLTLIDIPLLFQYAGPGGGYFEAGPMYSLVNAAKFKLKDNLGSFSYDAKRYFPDNRISVMFGFGMDASLDDGKWFLKVGFRGVYTFDDMLGVHPYANVLGAPVALHPVITKEPTQAIAGGIHIGLTYKFNY